MNEKRKKDHFEFYFKTTSFLRENPIINKFPELQTLKLQLITILNVLVKNRIKNCCLARLKFYKSH
jgi:hypothetical protein